MEGVREVERALQSIQRLAAALKSLQGPPTSSTCTGLSSSFASLSLQETPQTCRDDSKQEDPWGHWRTLSPEMVQIYALLHTGADVLKAVSTKFTLIGAMDIRQVGHLAVEMQQGCEVVSTATLALYQPGNGCAKPTRTMVRQAARTILASVISLLQAVLHPPSTDPSNKSFSRVHPILAQKTGAVWDACDCILNKKLPKGNRASVRRQILTFITECNDTLSEFESLISMGPSCMTQDTEDPTSSTTTSTTTTPPETLELHTLYTPEEIPVARASLALISFSKRIIMIVLQILELVAQDESNISSSHYHFMKSLYDLVYTVGLGVTDVGVLLYPPMDWTPPTMLDTQRKIHSKEGEPVQEQEHDNASPIQNYCSLQLQLGIQATAINAITQYVLTQLSHDLDLSLPTEMIEALKHIGHEVDVHQEEVNQLLLCHGRIPDL